MSGNWLLPLLSIESKQVERGPGKWLLPLLSIESKQVERGPVLDREMSTTLFAFGQNYVHFVSAYIRQGCHTGWLPSGT